MKSNIPLFKTLLVAAAASLSFYATPAWAEADYTLSDGDQATASSDSDTFNDKSFEISSSILSAENWGQEGSKGAWITWTNLSGNNLGGSLGTVTITGEGFLGLAVRYGGSNVAADLTSVDASGFTGQFTVVNIWNKDVTVTLGGDTWAGVEYIFGSVTAEWAGVTSSGNADNTIPYHRGSSADDTGTQNHDTLALSKDTTLAGVTGTSKDYTAGVTFANDDSITVNSAGTTLTIAGTGEYAFYGTVGASGTEASLAMTGEGKQTFGGTNYLQNVTVSAGTLALGGTTDISGTVSVAEGSTLDLSGTITLTNTISNSGTVVVDSDVVFVLDKLTANDTTYTIISGTGTIDGWSSLDYSNFSISGTTLTSDRQITVGADGSITYNESGAAQSLTWAGSSGNTWDSGNDENQVWTNNATTNSDYFVNGDSVTFTSTGAGTVTVSGNVHAAEMTVSGSYTFANSEGSTLTVDSVSVTGGAITVTLTGGEFTIGSYVQDSGTDTASAFEIGANTTVTMDNFHANWHQTTTLGEGAVWTVTTQLWYSTNATEVITGGTINAQQLNVSNLATVSIYGTNLYIGSGGIISNGNNSGWGNCGVTFGDDLTVGVWGGTDGNNKSWSTDATIQFTGTGTGTTFHTETGENITLSGSLSGSGFTNTGEGTLILSGTVALDSAISNSGNITIDGATFVLDNLTMGTSSDKNYYIVITGDSGTVSAEGIDISNFTGGKIDSAWSVWTDGLNSGYLVIYGEASQNLTWDGSNGVWDYSDGNWSGGSTFATGDNVTFNGSGNSAVTLEADIEAGTIDIKGSTGYTISNGEGGTSLKADSLTVETDQGVTTTITVSTLTIDGAISVKPVSGDSQGDRRVLVIGDGQNATTATAGSLFMQGESQLEIAYGSTLTVTGDMTETGGYGEVITGAGTLIIEGTVTHGLNNDFVVSIANFQANAFTLSSNTARATFSGGASTVGTLTLGTSGASVTYTGEGNHTVGELIVHTNQTATLDYSNLTGSLTITKLDFGNTGTLNVNGNANGTITEVSFTNDGVTLEVNGVVNVGTMNITTQNDMGAITIAEGATLNVTGAINVSPGNFGAGYYSTITGAGADKSTVVTGSLTIGSGNTGAGLEVKDTTFITGGINFEGGTGMYYLYLDNVTLGFTQDTVTIAASTTSNSSYLELGDHGSGSSTETTSEATKTTINTNLYADGAFTDTGVTVTIAEMIAGTGTLAVTGNGSLTLSGANTYTGGTIIDAGKVIAANNSALGTGDVTIENGGQLEVNSSVTISNNINIILSEANISSASKTSLVVTLAAAGDTDVYALIGSGTISNVTITITVDEAVAQLLAAGGEYTFDIYDSSSLTLNNVTINYDALTEAGYTVNQSTGQLIIQGLPEPELFSVFFGISALGLMATRRRRRKVA